MRVSDVVEVLQRIAPLDHASLWDNVGLIIGSPRWPARSIMLTIDLTLDVLREAKDAKAGMIIAYHPPIFTPIRAMTDAPATRAALQAAAARIAVYSPHTALDAAPGGVNDWLAECLGAGDSRALQPQATLPESEECKIVTFCPAEAVDAIRIGLASAGAGRIGAYEHCSFQIEGRGTFRGGSGTQPAIGRQGRLERVDEIRLEMVCPRTALHVAVAALRQSHPYEEPPIEIYQLQPRPQQGIGQGRLVLLDQPATLRALLDRIKRRLRVKRLSVAAGHDAPARHDTIGLCAGAGGSLLDAAIEQGCSLYLTGELRHHDVLSSQARGCSVVLAGHTNTERGYLRVLRSRLARELHGATIMVSRRDTDPLRLM